jgi:hypothetical protein
MVATYSDNRFVAFSYGGYRSLDIPKCVSHICFREWAWPIPSRLR